MAKTAILTWVLPTVREDGSPLAAEDIDYTAIKISADAGVTFTEVGRAPSPETAFTQTELEDGDYVFRAVVVDKQTPAKTSAAVEAAISVRSALAAPGPVTGLAVSIS